MCRVLAFIIFLFLFLIVNGLASAQTSWYTSAQNGLWGTPATWTCTGVCATLTPSSLVTDEVIINHAVTSALAIEAFSIRIENAISNIAQHAQLIVSGTGSLVIGNGGLMLNGV